MLVELEKLHYSTLSQTQYRQFYPRVLRYIRERGLADYSDEVGHQLLATSYGCDWLDLPHPVPANLHVPLRYSLLISLSETGSLGNPLIRIHTSAHSGKGFLIGAGFLKGIDNTDGE